MGVPLPLQGAGRAAEKAETSKVDHYAPLNNTYCIQPIAVETYGSWGKSSLKFIKGVGEIIAKTTGEKKSIFYLLQNMSMIIQRSLASCIVGSIGHSTRLEEVFYL